MVNPPNRAVIRVWFTLALRIIGMWELVVTAGFILTAFDISAGFYHSRGDYTFGHFFLAAWLLKGAPMIEEFFYPDLTSTDKSSDDRSSGSGTDI
jgi:hypothetical protein